MREICQRDFDRKALCQNLLSSHISQEEGRWNRCQSCCRSTHNRKHPEWMFPQKFPGCLVKSPPWNILDVLTPPASLPHSESNFLEKELAHSTIDQQSWLAFHRRLGRETRPLPLQGVLPFWYDWWCYRCSYKAVGYASYWPSDIRYLQHLPHWRRVYCSRHLDCLQ